MATMYWLILTYCRYIVKVYIVVWLNLSKDKRKLSVQSKIANWSKCNSVFGSKQKFLYNRTFEEDFKESLRPTPTLPYKYPVTVKVPSQEL